MPESHTVPFSGASVAIVFFPITGVPIGILQSTFSRVAMDEFGLSADYNGMVMSYVGILTMVRYATKIDTNARSSCICL